MTMLDLAARCEAATDVDRLLSWDIWEAMGRPAIDDAARDGSAPAYTASVDAAMSLVPGNYSIQMGRGWRCDIKEGKAWATVADRQFGPPNIFAESENAATVALAVAAAALKARHAAERKPHDG